LKKIYISLVCLLVSINAFSQANFYKLSVGGGAGVTRAFGDLNKSRNSLAIYGVADYYLTPFITLGIEGQIGKLKGGDSTSTHKRYFENDFIAASINTKFHLGAFFDKGFRNTPVQDVVNGIYVGTGIGIIRNKISEAYHKEDPRPPYDQGRNNSKDAYVPVNLGIDYSLKDVRGYDRFLLNLNLQGNLTFGEGLDGYDDAPVYTHNQYADVYIFTSIGIKYKFGLVGYHQ
jgi:hypothetical protein